MTDINQVEATEAATETVENQEAIEESVKTFSQEQLDKIVEDRLLKQRRQFERRYAGVDTAKYQEMIEAEEAKKMEAKKARGEFETILKDTVSKHTEEVNKLKSELTRVKVDGAVLSTASSMKAINPEQVATLLKSQVRLGDNGEAEVIDSTSGQVRYNDKGEPLGVSELVGTFLKENPHFAQATPGGADTKSNLSKNVPEDFDPLNLDMSKPEHREKYRQYKANL